MGAPCWVDAHADALIEILGRHLGTQSACDEFSKLVGVEVTTNKAAGFMKRLKRGAPSSYLAGRPRLAGKSNSSVHAKAHAPSLPTSLGSCWVGETRTDPIALAAMLNAGSANPGGSLTHATLLATSAAPTLPLPPPGIEWLKDHTKEIAAIETVDRIHVDRMPEPLPRIRSTGIDTWIIFSDAHIPFHDRKAYGLVEKVCTRLKPYGVASIGDFADMLAVSTHPKAPQESRWQLEDEMTEVRERRAFIDSLNCERRAICLGNHETRGQRVAMDRIASLYKTLDPDHIIEFSKHGWEVYRYQEHVKIGKIHLVHDVGHCGVNAVLMNARAFQASVMTGHTHAAECRYFGNVLGENHVSMSIGWLGDRKAAKYMPQAKKLANWQHAFGVMYVERATQNTHAFVVPIVDGRCVVGGELFEADHRSAA